MSEMSECAACGEELTNGHHYRGTKACMAINPDAVQREQNSSTKRLPPEECLEYGNPTRCRGPVEYRWPGYGHRNWPRCEHHGLERVRREEENIRRYNPDGVGPPSGFDPSYAGERWDDDAY